MTLISQLKKIKQEYMKHIAFYLFLIVFITNCKEKGKTKEETATESGNNLEVESKNFGEFSDKLKSLVKSDSGIVRGFNFSTGLDEILSAEDSSTVVEESNGIITYSIHLDSLEEAEVLYYTNGSKTLDKVEVNIYPNSTDSRAELVKEFYQYYSGKYGAPYSEIEEVKIWRIQPENLIIEMRMLGNSKVHDIQIDYKKINSES